MQRRFYPQGIHRTPLDTYHSHFNQKGAILRGGGIKMTEFVSSNVWLYGQCDISRRRFEIEEPNIGCRFFSGILVCSTIALTNNI